MGLEEPILLYYIRIFSILFILLIVISLFYFFYIFNKKINLIENNFSIKKGEKIEKILISNIKNISQLEIFFMKIYYQSNYFINNKYIHFGDFDGNNIVSLNSFFKIICQPGNVLKKITIVDGWSKNDLESVLDKNFNKFKNIEYQDIIADSYFFHKGNEFDKFLKHLVKIKKEYFDKHKNNKIFNNFSENEIMIIGSLIDKEGLDYEDKRNIASVIFNRLNINMKLQIDATVLYALTDGNYDLKRNLLFKDLKIDHPFNTYNIYGLPPKPISYVGKETLDIIFENYKTDFLFYFFNNSLNRHIFSENFEDHKNKINEYRKN